ncbi:MAG: FG-GAP repeat protein [Deltaproteobacteria bacterium]|nr:FG-GAP repeat protein [Deltaproteobacteria bacterium]
MKSGFQKIMICFALMTVAHLTATVAFARTDEDLASISVDGEWLGMAGDKLGGMFLEDVMEVYWDTPLLGDDNTDRGPVSSPAVTSCDFDGDGYPDLAIGAPDGDKVYLFYGNPASPNPGLLDMSTASNYDVLFTGSGGSEFGIELASADVNGDGYCDLLVGASGVGKTGAVYLFLGDDRGGTSGLFPAGPGAGVDASANYSLRVVGKSEYSFFATDSVAFSVAVGDLSGDGLADFAVGAFYMDRTNPTSEQDAGAVAVYFGKATVTHANTSSVNLTMEDQTVGGASFDGYNVRYFGQEGYPSGAGAYNGETENLGSSVACVDLNGDGVDDLAMGAPCPEINYSASGTNDTGSVYVIFGGGAADGTGTANLGTGPVILGDANTYHIRFNAVQDWAHLGAAMAGGDLTGDGVEDLVVAAPCGWYNFSEGDESGSIYLIAGDTAWQGMARGNSNIDLIAPGNGYNIRIDGAAIGDELRSVAVGDVDGDGQADLLLGAPKAEDSGRTDCGATYEFYGPMAGTYASDLSSPGGHDRRTLGAVDGDRLGTAVAFVDYPCGFVRRVLSAPYASSNAGQVYLMASDWTDTSCGGFCSSQPDDTPCDDGDSCNVGETCQSGSCVGGGAQDCSGTGSFCRADSSCDSGGAEGNCDTLGGGLNEGVGCDDGDVCNVGETCQSGSCTGSSPMDCSGTGDFCRADSSCDSGGAEGNCDTLGGGANEGVGCDDGDVCNVGETCQSGSCAGGGAQDCSGTGSFCRADSTCDSGGAEGNCDTLGGGLNEGVGCDDGDVCAVGETCQSGSCAGGGAQDCSGTGSFCRADSSCDSGGAEGNCDTLGGGLNEGVGCDDGDVCNVGETCQSGSCTGSSPMDCSGTGSFCRADSSCDSGGAEGNCDTLGGGVNEGAGCDDGDVCNVGETCQSGSCAGGGAQDCSGTGSFCLADSSCDSGGAEGNCDTLGGGIREGVSCDDGDVCNVGETCQSGSCAGGGAQDCSGTGSFCRADSSCDSGGAEGNCDTLGGGINEGVVCEDGNLCTIGDICMSGSCDSGSPLTCAASDQCHVAGDCDPNTGLCSDPPAVDDTPCDDGVGCTFDDVCTGGVCAGAPLAQDDTSCDGFDDDCDGGTDEDYVSDDSCGLGYCLEHNVSSTCVAGVETACLPGDPLSADDTTCDTVDDDCDGLADEDYLGDASCGVGYCQDHNTPSGCVAGVETACEPGDPLSASDASCDAVDDDCDGLADEDYASDASCGVGYCQDHNLPSTCVAGVETACQPGAPLSADDPTCDSVDDDCDGMLDEDSDCFVPNVTISLGENSPEGVDLASGLTLPVFQVRVETHSVPVDVNRLRLSVVGLKELQLEDHSLLAQLHDDPNGDGQVELDGEPLGESVVVDPASGEIVFEDLGLSMANSESRTFVLTLSLSRHPSSGCGCASAEAGSAWPLGFVFLGLLFLAPGRRRRAKPHGRSLVALALVVALIALGGMACGRYGFDQVAMGHIQVESNQDLQVQSEQWPDVQVEGAPVEGSPFLVRL